MSTPSETMRTAMSQGSDEAAKRAISAEAPGSSEVTTRGVTPKRTRRSAAMPRACSRSVAITSPAASGCSRRTSASRACAARSTAGSHSPSSESAVRSRWLARAASSRSSNVAEWTVPSGALHSIWPFVAGKKTGRTTRRSCERVAVAVLEVGHRLVRRCRSRRGSRACRSGTASPRGRAAAAPASNAFRIAAPHARSSPAWWSSSSTTNAPSRDAARSGRAFVATCWYEVTIPCMSAGSAPSAGDHDGSRWSENARRRARPLVLQVRGRRDDDEPGRPHAELVPRRRQREGRLAGAGRRDREEVALRRVDEAVEGGLLPAAEVNRACHRVGGRGGATLGPPRGRTTIASGSVGARRRGASRARAASARRRGGSA